MRYLIISIIVISGALLYLGQIPLSSAERALEANFESSGATSGAIVEAYYKPIGEKLVTITQREYDELMTIYIYQVYGLKIGDEKCWQDK